MSTCSNLTGPNLDFQPAVTVSLEGKMTVANVTEIAIQFRRALDAGRDLLIDLANVTEIDIAGIQLLCAVRRATRAAGRSMSLASPLPEVLRQTFILCGVDPSAVGDVVGSRS